jgi:hypothetical protein
MSSLLPAIGDTIDLGPRGEGIVESVDEIKGKIVIRRPSGQTEIIDTHDICLVHITVIIS